MKKARIDKLGRIVIPISYRRHLNITTETDLLINCDDRIISILPIPYTCRICGSEIKEKTDIPLCGECISKIKSSTEGSRK